jgi:succinate dehydrogenase/fumarate reductase flavoprotein subunit
MDEFEEMGGSQVEGQKKGLTRRSFLGAAAVAGVAAGASSGLLGVPSAFAAGSDWSEKDAANIVWDKECDVLFVGTGYAALCAAIETYDAGTTDILVIEKANANAIGGNSILCAGAAQFAGTDIEAAQDGGTGAGHYPVPAGYADTPNDTVAMMIEDSLVWGDYRANKDVLAAVTAPCPDTVKWLRDHLGLVFRPATTFQYGMRDNSNPNIGPVGHVARTHQPQASTLAPTDPNWYPGSGGISYWYVMYNYLKKKGFTLGNDAASNKILTEHKAVRFIQAGVDGPVVGLEVQGPSKTINIRTRKGVVLGSGGWKSNVAMRTNWDPRLDADFSAGGLPYVETTGEMIMAANDIGADLTGMDFVCEFRVKWATQIYQHWFYDITKPTDGSGLSVSHDNGMCVNISGKRYVDEYTSTTIDSQDFCEAYANMQTPRAVWFVCSDDKVAANSNWRTAIANPQPDVSPCVTAGMILNEATVDALAAKMGVNATNLAAEITKFNGYVDNAIATGAADPDFGRPAAHLKVKIDTTKSLWAVKAKFFAHDQMSGITVNTKGQVVKRQAHIGPAPIAIDQQAVIERLYAAGECCGGYFGNERGHGKIGIVMNAGRIAGKQVVKEPVIGAQATAMALKTNHASAVHGHSVTLTGTLSGASGVPAGGMVQLQARVPGKASYANVGAPVATSAARTAAKSYKLAKKGTYFFRMKFAGTTSFAPCTSKSVKVVSK